MRRLAFSLRDGLVLLLVVGVIFAAYQAGISEGRRQVLTGRDLPFNFFDAMERQIGQEKPAKTP